MRREEASYLVISTWARLGIHIREEPKCSSLLAQHDCQTLGLSAQMAVFML